jgi:hypothetical protein
MTTLINSPKQPNHQNLKNSYIIISKAHDASSSFLEIFNITRTNRNARGTPTDAEQDLLRAMLIFASSGLDSMVKQLTRDSLSLIIDLDEGAHQYFSQFVERKLKKNEEFNYKFIADIISDKNPRIKLIDELVNTLTSDSIQSLEQLFKVAAFFNIPSKKITSDPNLIKKIFSIRNEISHEIDIDFSQPNRNRRPRSKTNMINFTNELFKISGNFLNEVNNSLKTT